MARERFSVGIVVTGVVVVVLFLGFLVHQNIVVRQWRGNFNEEMAQRMDLEEKIAQMEKVRSALLADVKDLKSQLEQAKAETEDCKSALSREREDKKSLQTRLDQATASLTTSAVK